jgi:hypothetical protein
MINLMACVNFIDNNGRKISFKACEFELLNNKITNIVWCNKNYNDLKLLSNNTKLEFTNLNNLRDYKKSLPFNNLGELKIYYLNN